MLQHLVAIGFPALEHTSLAVNRSGKWLLYLAGTDLYVSEDGARPRQAGSAACRRRRLDLSAAAQGGTPCGRSRRACRAAGTRAAVLAGIRASASAQVTNWASSSSSSCSRMVTWLSMVPPSNR